MTFIARLKKFDTEELVHVLRACAYNLSLAYKETQDTAFYFTAVHARDACNYLMYQLDTQEPKSRKESKKKRGIKSKS